MKVALLGKCLLLSFSGLWRGGFPSFFPPFSRLLRGLIVMQRPVDVDVTVLHFRSWRPPMQLSWVGVCARCVCVCVGVCLGVLVWVFQVLVCVCVCKSGVLYCATTLAHAKVVGVLGAVFTFLFFLYFLYSFLFLLLAPNLYKFCAAYFLALGQGFFGDAVWATWLYKHTPAACSG